MYSARGRQLCTLYLGVCQVVVLRATKFSKRAGALIAAGTVVLAGAVVPTSVAYAVGSPQHEPGLYVSVGGPTQLKRGQIDAGGALTMEAVGAPSSLTYNALAAHLPTASLYAVANSGALLQVLDDGSVEDVELPDGSPVDFGGTSSAAAFGEGARADQMFYVADNGRVLGCFDVAQLEYCTPGAPTGPTSLRFTPIDMAWTNGYFWGLEGNGSNAKLFRMSSGGEVTTANVPAIDPQRIGSGSYGAAWTYGNGNLGFMSNGGGSVQLKITSADPIQAEIVGYSTGATSNQLDGAMIPPAPGDVELSFTSEWTGVGDSHQVTATVRNVGATPVTGYQLQVEPDAADTRPVALPNACTATGALLQCIGGGLLPGEARSLQLGLGEPTDPAVRANQWSGRVELNEVDTNPANNIATFSPSVPAAVDVRTEVKARVIDTNNDGAASPGEKMEIFVVVSNHSAETLSNVSVEIDTIFPQTRELEGQIPPGARRTIRFVHETPQLDPDSDEIVLSSMRAQANGRPVTSLSGELIVLGDGARPIIKPAVTPTEPPGANASATGDAAVANSAGSGAAGADVAAGSQGDPAAAALSATGTEGRSPAFALGGLCLLLALAIGGAGLRRSRRQTNE